MTGSALISTRPPLPTYMFPPAVDRSLLSSFSPHRYDPWRTNVVPGDNDIDYIITTTTTTSPVTVGATHSYSAVRRVPRPYNNMILPEVNIAGIGDIQESLVEHLFSLKKKK